MYKKHLKFTFITLLIMPRLSKHEKSGKIGMLQAGLRVTHIAQYYNCHPSTIQVLRNRYQATGMVKDRHLSGKQRIITRRPDSIQRPVALSSLLQNQRTANFIDQHDNAPAHTARLTVNFQAPNIILMRVRPPLSRDMSAIELLIATLKSKGIAI